MALNEARILHVSIDVPHREVYAFVGDPENLPHWAPNFGDAMTRDGDGWVMRTAEGPVPVRFVAENELGVLDHWVRIGGTELHNPIRVVPNGSGSLVTFTLFRRAEMTDAEHEADAALVAADLALLKRVVEGAE